MSEQEQLKGEAAGVPFVAVPPDEAITGAPSVVVWHPLDPPRSESAMQAALPLTGLSAWRIYLGLPMSGTRLPEGGLEAFFQLGYEDAVLQQFEPIVRGAVTEFPAALADLRERIGIGRGPLGLVGASVGALVALSVLTETDIPVSAVALVSPAIRLASIVAANERRFEVTYPWNERSRAVAAHLDFVARADDVAARGVPALLVVGSRDDAEGVRTPAQEFRTALGRHSGDHADLVEIPEMEHALAVEPGLVPAPQTPHAGRVDDAVVEWLHRRLTASRADRQIGGNR